MTKKKKWPKKWINVYPAGTTEGNDEARLFKGNGKCGLARHPKFDWRTVSSLAKESGLTDERVEEILDKYVKLGMVFQSPKNPEMFVYWERATDLVPDVEQSIANTDKKKRIDMGMIGTFNLIKEVNESIPNAAYSKNDFNHLFNKMMDEFSSNCKQDWIEINNPESVEAGIKEVKNRLSNRTS